jgi:KaiC/GvpD/RAD55 family RecA-like ATPase
MNPIEALKAAIVPYEFFSEYFDLTRARAGKLMVKCIFHDDGSPSLMLYISEGRFHCFSCGEHGDIIDFYAKRNSLTIEEAIKQMCGRYGIERKAEKKPEPPTGCTMAQYAEAKGLSPAVLKQAGCHDCEHWNVQAVAFPYRDQTGALVTTRYRVSLTGSKRVVSEKGETAPLYGSWLLPRLKRFGYVVLVEGESDCHTLWQHKIPALGIPGASSWRDEWAQYFDGFSIVYFVQEPDSGGAALAMTLRKSPLSERLVVVNLPEKDTSAFYLAHRRAFAELFRAELDKAEARDGLDRLRSDIAAELAGERRTIPLPWCRLSDGSQALRPGTVCIVAGPSGVGKSVFVIEIALSVHRAEVPWAYLPLEDRKSDLQRRFLAVLQHDWRIIDDDQEGAAWRAQQLEAHKDTLLELSNHLYENPREVTIAPGQIEVKPLPASTIIDWIGAELRRARVVFVDPLSQIDFDAHNQWKQERELVLKMVGLAANSGGTIVLVAHTVKRPGKAGTLAPTIEDIQGSAAFGRNCHTVLLVDAHDEKNSPVYRDGGVIEGVMHSRTVVIAKTRNGRGPRQRVAYNLSLTEPHFVELGIIAPKAVKGGVL